MTDQLIVPEAFAGVGVQGYDVGVEPADDDLAVCVGDAAVVDVAAGELVVKKGRRMMLVVSIQDTEKITPPKVLCSPNCFVWR